MNSVILDRRWEKSLFINRDLVSNRFPDTDLLRPIAYYCY